MPGKIQAPSETNREGTGPNAVLYALSRGYVVAAPAIRGRTTTNSENTYVGKAPALIVDYKAAVRYLRHNRDRLPAGDTQRIIANGTSAGGALSALLARREIAMPMSLISKKLAQKERMIFLRRASIVP